MGWHSVTAFAPGSVGNIGVGFDILGHAYAGLGDRVTVRRVAEPGVRIAAIRGAPLALPTDPERNTAGAALLSLRQRLRLTFGFEIEIDKGLPFGAGLGGSAASASAATVAANHLLDCPLDAHALYQTALDGEEVATGARHGDNVAPQLLGGIVLLAPGQPEQPIALPVPSNLWCALVHPAQVLETRLSRAALRAPFELATVVQQTRNLAGLLLALERGDLDLLRLSLCDVLVEPRRAGLIPGFPAVKAAALGADALGASISGGGPSVFAWCLGEAHARLVGAAMVDAFAACGVEATAYAAAVASPGAHVEHSA